MSMFYPIGGSGQQLVFDVHVLDHFNEWRQSQPDKVEAGGQLFGVVDEARVIIKEATGPRRSDRRGRFFFVADRFAERREIKTLHKSKLHYFGDWHTHPEAIPAPSRADLTAMADLVARSKHELHAFLMVIVGTDQFPDGLHVSLHEANVWSKLRTEC